jgi:hypothetical protein
MALREGEPTATNGRRPRSGRVSDRADPEIRSRSRDPVWGEITSLTDRIDIHMVLRLGLKPCSLTMERIKYCFSFKDGPVKRRNLSSASCSLLSDTRDEFPTSWNKYYSQTSKHFWRTLAATSSQCEILKKLQLSLMLKRHDIWSLYLSVIVRERWTLWPIVTL